jgi:hypothetical protein
MGAPQVMMTGAFARISTACSNATVNQIPAALPHTGKPIIAKQQRGFLRLTPMAYSRSSAF